MSVRFRITHKEKVADADLTYRVDILDDEYGGEVKEKVSLNKFFVWDYPNLDVKDLFDDPVQKSSLAVDLAAQVQEDQDLLDDILDADEDRFQINFYIDGTLKWSGKILNDLIEYPEEAFPYTGSIIAKDISGLDGVDYEFVNSASPERLSVIIADCLKETGLTLPLRSYTNITNSELVDTSLDFLYNIYHQKYALRNQNEAISRLDVLVTICRAYNLIIRQSDARWIIEQVPAVAKGDAKQFDYDSDGLNPVSSTPSRTITIDGTDSFVLDGTMNKVTGALKQVRSDYNHRVWIINLDPLDDITHTVASDETTIDASFEPDGSMRFVFSVDVTMQTSNTGNAATQGKAFLEIIGGRPSGQTILFYDQNSNEFSAGTKDTEITLSYDASDPIGTLTGSLDIAIDGSTPIDPGIIRLYVLFKWGEAEDNGGSSAGITIDQIDYTNIEGFAYAEDTRDWQAQTAHEQLRTGSYTLEEKIQPTLLGDGPVDGANLGARGRPMKSAVENGSEVLATGNYKIRGEASSKEATLEEVRVRERLSSRRSALRRLQSILKVKYSPESLISYDGETWFFLGGRLGGKGSRWNASIVKLTYSRDDGNDTYSTIVEEGGNPSGSTVGTSPSSADTTDHGNLTGLGDDDHPQYLLIDGSRAMTGNLDLGGNALENLDEATTQSNLSLVPGMDIQEWDAGLDDISGLSPGDGNFIVGDGSNWVAESGATARASLGLTIGSDVQAHGDVLDDLNTLGAATADGQFLVATGAGVFGYESGDTALASLGLSANLGDLTDSEASQLENIGATTISATQWGYLGALDQDLATTDAVTFAQATLSNLTSGRVLLAGTSGLIEDDAGLTFDGTEFSAPTLRTDNGKFLSPASYQFRNAGDTSFRDVQMGALTADAVSRISGRGGVFGITNFDATLELDSDFPGIAFGSSGNGARSIIRLENTTGTTSGDGRLAIFMATSAQTGTSSFIERFTLLDDGAMGLGNSSPEHNLHIKGNYSDFPGLGNPQLLLEDTSGDFSGIGFAGTSGLHAAIRAEGGDGLSIWGFANAALSGGSASPTKIAHLKESGETEVFGNLVGTTATFSSVLTASGVSVTSGNVGTDNFSAGSTGWQITYAGDGEWNDGDFRGTLEAGGLATLKAGLEDNNFTSGFQGSNWQVTTSGDAEFENLLVRGGLEVYELILNQLRYQDGGLIIGHGGGKVDTVSGATGSEDVTFKDPEGNTNFPFSAGSIVLIQSFDLDGTTVVKKIVREVSSITTGTYTLTTPTGWTAGTANDDTGSIEAGDDMVAIGHSSDGTLDSFLYMSAVDSNNPFLRIMDGVDNYNKFDLSAGTALRLQLGNLNGTYDYSSEVYGLAAGNPGADYFTIDPTNGVRFVDGADSDAVIAQFSSQVFTLGESGGEHVTIDNSGASLGIDIDASTFNLSVDTLVLDSTTPKIAIGASASAIDLTTGTGVYANGSGHFKAGSTSKFLKWDGTNILMEAGNASIGASSGWLGASDVLSYSADEVGLAGFTADASHFWTDDGASGAGTFTGLQPGTGVKQLFAGADDNTGTNATFFVKDGELFYDGLLVLVYSRTTRASFGTTTEQASQLNDDYYIAPVSRSADGTSSSGNLTKLRTTYLHRAGIKSLKMRATVNIESDSHNSVSSTHEVILSAGGQVDSQTINSDGTYTFEIDVSGLTAGNVYEIDMDLDVSITITGGTGDIRAASTQVREDVVIFATTDEV